MEWVIFISIVALALAFDYINGFHDAANAIATVVSTKTLSPRTAVLYGATLNFVGALLGTEVASTIGKGMVDASLVTPEIILVALSGAIVWNLLTWYFGLPSSSSHALIGALCGAAVFGSPGGLFHGGISVIHLDTLGQKVVIPMVTSPISGFVIGYILALSLIWAMHKFSLFVVNSTFSRLQLVSSGYLAISHGMSDAQKSMGIIALAITTFFHVPFHVPLWVKMACAIAMGMGTMSGGWKIIRTMSSKMIKLQTIQGFSAEVTAGTLIMTASMFGIPLSTTHLMTSSIMGVGATKRFSAVKWGVVSQVVWAWVLTIPFTFFFSGLLFWGYASIKGLFH